MSIVIYLHHTHPELRWYNDEAYWTKRVAQADTAVHVIFPGPVNMIFHWIMEHNAHHARPGIPLYNLPQAQRFLERESAGKVIVFKWTLGGHLDIIRRCKLYDYERACWVDFQGNSTSSPAARIADSPVLATLQAISHDHAAAIQPHLTPHSVTPPAAV
jgi:omega-6 fatty acid desaturase (delta-12 desaturase)